MHTIKISGVNMFTWNFPFLLFVLVTCGVLRVDAQRSCYTPYNAFGQCVHYKTCSYLTQQLEKFGSQIPQEFLDFVKNSRCPSSDKQVYVCCEKRYVVQPTIATTPPPPTPMEENAADLANQQINQVGFNILSAVKCGEIRGNKVAFGNKTSLNEFPFMALLKYDTSEIYNCGGALISNRYVLTAAHCWIGIRDSPYAVRLGEYDYNSPRDCMKKGKREFCNPPVEDIGIEKLIPHPLYSKKDKIHHDIGLIRLEREVTFNVHIQPVCLPIHKDSQALQSDQRYIVAGWGTTESASKSSLLLKAVIPYRPTDYCQNIFTNYLITDSHICAGGDNRVDSCKGDSGGPLFFQSQYNHIPRYVQYGIVSNGVPSCGVNSYPTVYTKVVSYLPWITNVIAQNES